jgi:hypothetical protein
MFGQMGPALETSLKTSRTLGFALRPGAAPKDRLVRRLPPAMAAAAPPTHPDRKRRRLTRGQQ